MEFQMKRTYHMCWRPAVWLGLILLLTIMDCKKDIILSNGTTGNAQEYMVVKTGIYQILKTGIPASPAIPPYYLWYDHVPAVDITTFNTPQDLLDSLMYKPLDRFSYLASKSEQQQYFEEGQYVGIGFSYRLDSSLNYRVAFVYKNSPLTAEGVQRGWKIKTINGVQPNPSIGLSSLLGKDEVGVTNTIVFADSSGTEHSVTVSKENIKMNTVLDSRILVAGGRKVGYIAFQGFIAPSVAEFDSAFADFAGSKINDLIIDLRYNGGGRVDVAIKMASAIAGDIASGKVFVRFENNDKHSDQDTSMNFESSDFNFGLNRVFFITSKATASASELLINGFKPYMTVFAVGDRTYGKPVGMYSFPFTDYDWVLVPICFRTTNANHEGNYFDGIPVNAQVPDDLDHQLGSSQEACLASALNYIQNGIFFHSKKSLIIQSEWETGKIRGLRAEIGAF
jgi:carboxyl-terminal processing protease